MGLDIPKEVKDDKFKRKLEESYGSVKQLYDALNVNKLEKKRKDKKLTAEEKIA